MISRDEILKIAKLAKLQLKEDEVDKFFPQIQSILSYIKKLDEVDTTNVEPTSHPISDIKNRFQDDDTADRTLSLEDVLKNAPRTKDEYVATEGVFK
ncbi:Asp-tRNA(Asn)/Glu-tRNA(Gln) amidotransferase GatCAB subunit C [candidate division WWE3 bacterium CG_4_9_14_0_2_um_filter_35_11]|uniref:Aspartyl/glutamyl-tRNA(Asn/Gln) amidotransferase subunit C n=1 Tax=candidate division WWE3 bacterium CG_4_9_14_0_2_um_filter_35_11 TaxID=1975077 RepID=A0A2M8EKR0_UNCKA|nr:MAG: Asp-tRNA(Asn)/Glu-tRNA(Gln) amidotransferase GatCAB subunit C [candidate division WWE3 bacterium CG10_big_fil_rev_8_21_14_0_10_35_32]PJC23318.1 MAG: Asp-tRNA(Asn)/Glu-tRNA(Gln) amidotransferase GatCAB subunit C [candidate division WWE3 bacterium CG_4_9_14_0_2_um_filter_35_11]